MEHELTNEISLERENNTAEIKSPADQESHNNNLDYTNSSSLRNPPREESKEIGNI